LGARLLRPSRRRRESYPFAANARGLGQVIAIATPPGLTLTTEVRFHPRRRWVFDFAFEELKLAIEYEGGIFSHKGHTRPERFRSDMEKYNEAQLAGWIVLRFGPDETRTGNAIQQIERALAQRLGARTQVAALALAERLEASR